MKKLVDIMIIESDNPVVNQEGVLCLKKTQGGYSAGNYLIECLELTDHHYLEKVYNRLCKEPLDIAVTDRIILRETTIEDASELYRILQTPEVKEFVNDEPSNFSDFCDKLEAYRTSYDFYDCGYWGIFEKKSGKLIGRCGVSYNNIEGEILPELGFLLDPAYTGRSFAYEAALKALDYAFDYLDETVVYARAAENNSKSIKLLKRLGFREKGRTTDKNLILYSMEKRL